MEIIKQFDQVLLKDGRKGTVVDVLGDQKMFNVDIGSSPKDWKNISVKREDILEILPSTSKEN